MPRRASARNQLREGSPPIQIDPPKVTTNDPLTQLRTNWKWAAFSQFFFTFNHLFAMNDVSLKQIEDDLVSESIVVLPRVMQRLLYTVSYDRKVSLSNWQTALRKQYRKRNPTANPIGPEPRVEEPEQPSTPPAEDEAEMKQGETKAHGNGEADDDGPSTKMEIDEDVESKMPESTRASTLERGFSLGASIQGYSVQPSEIGSVQAQQSLDGETMEQETSKNWLDLPMLTKLDSMHLLTEWQFQHPTRLRTLMRTDDENASWRIEPIGYDSKKNAYWLIGADRIWLQRPIPKQPRPKTAASSSASLKRKRGGTAASGAKGTSKGKGKSKAAPAPATKRPRLQEQEPTTGRSRAAKTQAKVKLDVQAKELAELNRQAAALARLNPSLRTSSRSPKKPAPPRGTRISARLRGREDEEEWQAVPAEWLHENANGDAEEGCGTYSPKANGKNKQTGLELDGSEISDLTELTEESTDRTQDDIGDAQEGAQEEAQVVPEQSVKDENDTRPHFAAPVDDRGLEEPPILPEGFIEWETICVTLEEWDHFAERFEKATHYTEKALYKILVNDIVPAVTEKLREIERQQQLSLAITQRKRSSRLLLRQSEKEEAETAARKRREEEERNSRARRQEVRAKKEEDEREKRELAREMRRREREEREERERLKEEQKLNGIIPEADIRVDVVGGERVTDTAAATNKQPPRHPRQPRKNPTASTSQNGNYGPITTSGSRTPVGEDWELDCEICNRHGINLDDGTPMMSCGVCSKWQHIACHDLADQRAGRRRRNWDQAEFFCLNCRAKKAGVFRQPNPPPRMPPVGMSQAQAHPNPYMTPSITNLHSSQYTNNNYAPPVAANGSTSYIRDAPMSNVRSVVPPQQHPNSHRTQLHQQYASPISFSHYQPQQRGFSSTAESLYGPSGHTQPYGYTAAHHSYPRYSPMNGGQTYQQTSQARWNINNTSSQRSTSEQSTPIPAPYTAGRDLGVARDSIVRHTQPTPPAMHWQQPPYHQSPLAVAGSAGATPQQTGSQYLYNGPHQPASS